MNSQFRIEIIETIEHLEVISEQWNKLLVQSSADTVFLTWEWVSSWAETYMDNNRKLFVLTVYDVNELVGIAPFYISSTGVAKLKQIEFLGSPEAGSDYLDVIIKKGRERDVTEALYDFLLQERSRLWDCFALRDIPSNSLFLLHLLNRIEGDGKYAEIRMGSFCPVAKLPASIDEFDETLSPNRRQQLKRHLKLLNNDGEVKHASYAGKDAASALREFYPLYENRRGANEPLFSFLDRFASRSDDIVQVDMMSVGGKNIAGLLHLYYGDSLSMLLMALDKSYNPKISIGNILVGLCLRKAVDRGIPRYDFLKGTESYKFHWANDGHGSLNLYFSRRKALPVLSVVGRFMKYTAKTALR